MKHEWIESCQRIDFERLEALVSERIGMLRLFVENTDATNQLHDSICRDLIMPCVGLLAQFVDCVQISEGKAEG